MKVISIGTDRKIFEEGSAVRQRMVLYGNLFERLDIIVFSKSKSEIRNSKSETNFEISKNVFIHPTNSKNKLFYVVDALKIINKLFRISNFEFRASRNLVISVQDPFETGIVGLALKLKYKLPLQVQIHTDFHNKYFILHSPLNLVRFFLAYIVLSFADSARVVSTRVAKSVGSLCENVEVLPIYTEEARNLKSEIRSKDKDVVTFLTVARLEKEKDLGTLIRAFAEAVKINPNTELVIVGDGSQRKKLENLSRILNLQSRIFFVGWSDDTAKYYADVDVYISPSLYEGYGMAVVEAAQYGLPLILSNTGVAGEIFKDGDSAFICKQRDIKQFAEAMIKMANDGELRKIMGEKAREEVKLLRIEHDEYLRIYKESLNKAVEYFNLEKNIFGRNILLRYLVAGITAASSNIFLLYAFTDLIGIWYLYSSILSFILAFILSFVLQKFWTFGDKVVSGIHHQLLKYLAVAFVGIFINTILMYVLVDIVHVWYVLAQVATGVIVAVFNFFAYKIFIFK